MYLEVIHITEQFCLNKYQKGYTYQISYMFMYQKLKKNITMLKTTVIKNVH